MTTTQQQLVALLAARSARRGTFILASGKHSDFYVDARLTSMSPDGLLIIGKLGLATITQHFANAQAIGGLTLGADPIAYAIALTSAQTHSPLRAFTVRKEAKAHGTGRLIEGPFQEGDRVVVIEDVITTGGSALKAIDALRAANATVLGVLALVDREEGGREALEAAGASVVALATKTEILAHL